MTQPARQPDGSVPFRLLPQRAGGAATAGPPPGAGGTADPDTGPRVLLLHGLGIGARVWDPYVAHARPGRRPVTAELPWRGTGGRWSHHPDPRVWMHRVLEAALEESGGEGIDVVVAHSYSAMLLLNLLGGADPDRDGASAHPPARYGIRGLVLVTPFHRSSPEDFDFAGFTGLWDRIEPHMAECLRVMGRGRGDERFLAVMARRLCELIGPYGWTRFFEQYLRTPWTDLAALDLPVLVVSSPSDTLAPPAEAEALARGLPRAELRPVPGCGHFPMTERSAYFAALVDDFVDRFRTGAEPAPPPRPEPRPAPVPVLRTGPGHGPGTDADS
ncbi:alpha/beta fold hydrolase [Streptomyces pactum]|uniref:alpha/beta fold hydrolase n=1 Tax=Streptomyces pactum TaxID=68249 RepID=UPI0036F52BFE